MTDTMIPAADISYHPLSFGDPNGRLFTWRGNLYRGIAQPRQKFYRELFERGVIQRLTDRQLLVPTQLTDLQLTGHDLVLEHRTVPFVSYPYEWCADMLKDAALLTIDLQLELSKLNFALHDAHPWNVLFDGCHPVFVDLGSIDVSSLDEPWCAHNEFCRFFVNPLRLMAHGHLRIARWLLHDYDLGVLDSDLSAVIPEPVLGNVTRQARRRLLAILKRCAPQRVRPFLHRCVRSFRTRHSIKPRYNTQSAVQFAQRLRRQTSEISIPTRPTDWSQYYEGCYPSFEPADSWTQKHRTVYRLLSELRPASVLDVASNRGWYSQLAARLGARVVAFDVDETCITQLYRDAKKQNLSILPLNMDLRNPSPGLGLCNRWFPPATQRFQCEIVMALAVVHHLVFKQQLNFEQITEALTAFSGKRLLVEFIPSDDQYVRAWDQKGYEWYTLENFKASLERKFRTVQVHPSWPEPRVLLLCTS